MRMQDYHGLVTVRPPTVVRSVNRLSFLTVYWPLGSANSHTLSHIVVHPIFCQTKPFLLLVCSVVLFSRTLSHTLQLSTVVHFWYSLLLLQSVMTLCIVIGYTAAYTALYIWVIDVPSTDGKIGHDSLIDYRWLVYLERSIFMFRKYDLSGNCYITFVTDTT